MKEKSVNEVLKKGKRSKAKIRVGHRMEPVIRVDYENGSYFFPENCEEDIKVMKISSPATSKEEINRRSNYIQWWLVKMEKNRDALNYAINSRGTLREKLRKFISRTKIKIRDISEYKMECGVVALEIVPKAWINNK